MVNVIEIELVRDALLGEITSEVFGRNRYALLRAGRLALRYPGEQGAAAKTN
jgi:hypothetical protein